MTEAILTDDLFVLKYYELAWRNLLLNCSCGATNLFLCGENVAHHEKPDRNNTKVGGAEISSPVCIINRRGV